MRATSVALVAVLTSCRAADGASTVTQLVLGESDTVIVNSRRPRQLPVEALDGKGRSVQVSGLQYERLSGDAFSVSDSGAVKCARNGDGVMRVSLGDVENVFTVLCRPVARLDVAGPIQLMAGDSASEIPMQALGPDGNAVELLAGRLRILDTTVAVVQGTRVLPREPGSTILDIVIGDKTGASGVHVYARASDLRALAERRTFIAVPLRLGLGEMRRWPLPPGEWMLTMLPEDDEAAGLRLRVEGASCLPSGLSKRRYTCSNKRDATVFVYHPSIDFRKDLEGTLLVRPVFIPK